MTDTPKVQEIREAGSDKPLTVEVVDGVLSISIGIKTIALAVENSPDGRITQYDEKTGDFISPHVIDPLTFAREVVESLLHEDELGTTPVHRLLINAFVKAIEDGAPGVDQLAPR